MTEPGSGKPLPKTYVKVFAKLPDGAVRFHKDGYTDLRGRFDYASRLGRSRTPAPTQYAVLVLSEQRGRGHPRGEATDAVTGGAKRRRSNT